MARMRPVSHEDQLSLVEHLFGCPEECLVRVGSADQHDVAVGQAEHPHIAALGAPRRKTKK